MISKINVGVKGMHCASCAKIIETELTKNPLIKGVNINPVTEIAEIISDDKLNQAEIDQQLKKLGYSFNWPKENQVAKDQKSTELTNFKQEKLDELKSQKKKLQVAVPLMSVILFVVFWSLAAKYLHFEPANLIPGSILLPIVFATATLIMFWIGLDFLKAVGRFIRYGTANMDTLIGLGTGVAYFYSTLIYLFPIIREALQLTEAYFFDVTIVVITLVYLGKYLESKAKLRTNETIEKLINLQTKTALVEREGKESEITLAELIVGDIVIVKPGMKIPADGLIIFGESAIDEALITGESLPVDKKVGDSVIGTTINKQGMLKIKINKVGSETVLATIIKAIENAQNTKAPIQKLADKVAGIFVPIVLVLGLITLAAWFLIGPQYLGWAKTVSLGITCFVSLLAIACPCALGLATPTGIIVGLGLASKNGLLIKNAASLEKFGRTKIMIFDKTGTITKGEPSVTDVLALAIPRPELISLAASLEKNSEHPLALAILNLAKSEKIDYLSVNNFQALSGQGVSGEINNKKYWLGNLKLMTELKISLPTAEINKLEAAGKTLMILATEKTILGIFAVADEIKESAKEAITYFKKAGIRTIMLSGDREIVARAIATQAGIDEVWAEVSPLEKAQKIREIKNPGTVVTMIGDGVNDAVALVESDIGIAMASGSDVAIESADITVLHGDLTKIIKALKISRLTMRKIKQNLFWAFFYNIIAIPIAAGVLYPAYGILLSPIIAAGAMSLSSLSIVFNTLLMRQVKI